MSSEEQQQQQLQQSVDRTSQIDFEFWIAESVKDRTFDEDFDLGTEFTSSSQQTGQFGRIYECKPKGTNVSMCLKIIPKNKFRRVFSKEVAHLLTLNHTNLVRLREIFENRESLYVVSDLHSGGEVLARVCKRSIFTERDAAVILRQILEGLKYLHDEELVHGNLKPSNFIYESFDPDASVKISDVATYTLLDRELIARTVSETPEFCAPEVIKRELCDYPSDMWSFGAFAYTLLCGEKPFNSEDRERLYKMIFKANYQRDSPNYESLSINAKDFLMKFFPVDPKKRASAREVLATNNWVRGRATRNEHLELSLASMPLLVTQDLPFIKSGSDYLPTGEDQQAFLEETAVTEEVAAEPALNDYDHEEDQEEFGLFD